MKRVLAWIAGLAMVALAAAVGSLTLQDSQTQAPFVLDATLGERAEGRQFAATITEVQRAERISDDSGWQAEGDWLVVDLEAEAIGTEVGALLNLAEVHVGERIISASERPASLDGQVIYVRVPQSGSLAFELPEDAAGIVTLRLGRNLEPRLDSVIELPIDLDALEVLPERALQPTGWAS